MCSVVVVLPASMWAIMPRLRIVLRSTVAMVASGVRFPSHPALGPGRETRPQRGVDPVGAWSGDQAPTEGWRRARWTHPAFYHAKWANALLDSAILMVF